MTKLIARSLIIWAAYRFLGQVQKEKSLIKISKIVIYSLTGVMIFALGYYVG